MAKHKSNPANSLSTQERIDLAKDRISKVSQHVLDCIAIHETNRIVLYTDKLSSQVSKTYASHAFIVMRESLFRFELIRLCAIWHSDNTHDPESIGTLVHLLDDHDVILQLARTCCGDWASDLPVLLNSDLDVALRNQVHEQIVQSQNVFGRQQGIKAARTLRHSINKCKEILASPELDAMKHMRDKHFAHSMNRTRREAKPDPISPMKYGQENELLEKTVSIVEDLHWTTTGGSFDFHGSQKMRLKHAEELWNNCVFTVRR